MSQTPEKVQVNLLRSWGTDRSIAEAAWVSTGLNAEVRTNEDVARVIELLATHEHGVPFEAVHFTWWMRVPRYVETQITKHRISSINGASGRYRKVKSGYQGMGPDTLALVMQLGRHCYTQYHDLCTKAYDVYDDYMTKAKDLWGIQSPEYKRFKEFYRGVLPQAQMTELHVTMNLRSFANFYRLRSAHDAQWEIQQVAQQMYNDVVGLQTIPVALTELEKVKWRV